MSTNQNWLGAELMAVLIYPVVLEEKCSLFHNLVRSKESLLKVVHGSVSRLV